MEVILSSAVLVLITVLFIIKGYEYYKIKWPEDYFGPEDKSNIFISTSPLYYLVFRLLPVFTAIFVTHGTMYKYNTQITINPLILGLLTGFLYSLITDGRVIKELITNSPNVEVFINKISQYFLHFITLVLLTITGGIAGFLSTNRNLQFLLPKFEGLMDNIWAAAITIILFFAVRRLINKPKEIEVDEVIKASAQRLKNKLNDMIENASRKYNADPILVKAVCIAEDIQRPKWVRIIEKYFGIIKPVGTYGIMQVKSKKPITDEKSINLAVKNYFAKTTELEFSKKLERVEKYNSNQKYIHLVEATYRYITPNV
jgi:hypothetical protein